MEDLFCPSRATINLQEGWRIYIVPEGEKLNNRKDEGYRKIEMAIGIEIEIKNEIKRSKGTRAEPIWFCW